MSDHPTLLIVEDDKVFGRVLTDAMQARGYRVMCYEGLDQAQAGLADTVADFAVLDLNLNGQSALPLIQPLKARNPDIRILVLTGYASIATAVEAVKLGADEYLAKPADADQIERALRGTGAAEETPPPSQPMSVRRLEWEHIQRVLNECDGNISAAARRLSMHRRTLQRKLRKRPVRR